MPSTKTAEKSGDKPAKVASKTAKAANPDVKTAKPKTTTKAVTKTATSAAKRAAAPSKPVVETTSEAKMLSPEQRRHYVEVAAYYIAERRGFTGGSELEDWLQAEAEIDRLLREGILKP